MEKWNWANYLSSEARKSFFNGGEKEGGEREKVKLILIIFGLRRE